MNKVQKATTGIFLALFFIGAFIFFGFLFTSVLKAQEYTKENPLILEDGTEMYGDTLDILPSTESRYGQLEKDLSGWRKVGLVGNKQLYLNVEKIEAAAIFRHVWVMFEFTDGAKVVPGHATGIVRVVSEATIDCSSGLTKPMRDFYLDKYWIIRTQTVYQNGQGMSFARKPGSIAWAMKEVSCNGASIEDVQLGPST